MGITTRKGDKGRTSLYGGVRVSKDNLRVEANGTIDELCSFIGLAKSLIRDRKSKELLESIQKDLFIIGAEVATNAEFLDRLKKRMDASYIKGLEEAINTLESKNVSEECCFYIGGENPASSALDIARTVARRAERRIVRLRRRGMLKNTNIVIYLNRLSDLLYLLARIHEKRHSKLKILT
ncbi:MAG TPA: cob(I)yrinic acid a,c-diamide adenosyltransferase [Candidatus Omnitrophica bacterium]|nr:cob(I)yrinic acid a,c-diamide adenosyltransferase [Candidatus Omnitrophota bacterium]